MMMLTEAEVITDMAVMAANQVVILTFGPFVAQHMHLLCSMFNHISTTVIFVQHL
jgi:hypothetical protein